MSCEDIPSLLDLQKVKKHAEDFGRLMGTGTGTSTNGVTGQVRPTYNKVIADLGFKPGSGDFTTGFTVMPGQRDYAWYDHVSRNSYAYIGTIPESGYQVTPGTAPSANPVWKAVTDQSLRYDLSLPTGAAMIETSSGETVEVALSSRPSAAVNAHNNDSFAHPQLSAFITSEADRAEAAADAASLSGSVYPDTASGLAATTNGQYFSVVSPVAEGYLALYRNNSGVAAFQKTYPSSALVKRLDDGFNKLTGDNGFSMDGSDGQSSIEVKTGDAKALVVGTHSTEMMVFDTTSKKVNVPASDLADVTVSNVIHLSDSDEPDTEHTDDLITSTRAKTIGSGKHSLTFDTVNGELISTFKIVDKSQNVGIVLDDDVPDITDGVPLGYEMASRLYQGTSTIARTGSRFWLSWRADKNVAAEAPGNFFVIGYSDDNCATVIETNVVKFSNDNHQIVDPMLWTNPETGELWLFWGSFGKAQSQDGIGGCWCSILENPLATIKPTWSKPFKYRNIGDPRRPVRIDGKWVQCIDMWRSDAAFPPVYPDTAGCEFVEFNPLTKTTVNIGHNTPNNPAGGGTYSGFFETEIVQLTGGRLMSTTRGLPGSELQRTFSTDGGKTWTAQDNYTVLFPVSSSRIWLGKTPTGRLLIAYNNDLVRRTLTVKLSDDEGETYPHSVILEPFDTPNTCSYPIVAFDGDEIYVTYDVGRGIANEIRVAMVKESEIVAGTSIPVTSIVSGPGI